MDHDCSAAFDHTEGIGGSGTHVADQGHEISSGAGDYELRPPARQRCGRCAPVRVVRHDPGGVWRLCSSRSFGDSGSNLLGRGERFDLVIADDPTDVRREDGGASGWVHIGMRRIGA